MKKDIKSLITSHVMLLLLVMVAMLAIVASGARKVSASEQKKFPYLIKVNRVHNTITVYEKDEKGEYTVPIKAMVCSVGKAGTQTKLGTFQTKEKYRWKELMGNVWGQYSTRIVGGILFHSVYYYGKYNPATLATKEFNKLGSAASHGCIRLTVEDAKWIYDNCAVGTTVVVYDDKKSPGPLGKPQTIKLPSTVRWDPTDPSDDNPYKDKKPTISGAKNITTYWGDEIDLLKGIKAKSSLGVDITSKVKIEGSVDIYNPGKYKVSYLVTDELGRSSKKTITVTVGDSKELPSFTGISDKVVGKDVVVDKKFALKGVNAYCKNIKLDNNSIKVTIEKLEKDAYLITYKITVGKKATTTEYAAVYVDKEPPVIEGMTDIFCEEGEIPDTDTLLEHITVSDNYSAEDKISLNVRLEEIEDSGYLIVYEAVDEFGNIAQAEAKIIY